jgi:hypothetical protein
MISEVILSFRAKFSGGVGGFEWLKEERKISRN